MMPTYRLIIYYNLGNVTASFLCQWYGVFFFFISLENYACLPFSLLYLTGLLRTELTWQIVSDMFLDQSGLSSIRSWHLCLHCKRYTSYFNFNYCDESLKSINFKAEWAPLFFKFKYFFYRVGLSINKPHLSSTLLKKQVSERLWSLNCYFFLKYCCFV